jgi:polysaccharide export outer membrane protein
MRNLQNIIRYRVEVNGEVKLPTIGKTQLAGMTIREAELYLEELYAAYYVRPYVMLEMTNNRVIVMPGSGGDAQVITLTNNNTTVTEALAMAGGVARRGNASKIKLIRRTEDGGRKVYLINLSKVDGIPDGDIIVQANDIIYVEPVPQLVAEALRDVTPLVGLITTFLVLINLVR